MQLPTVTRSIVPSVPPMYAWPRTVKRLLLVVAIAAVVGAYLLLGSGIIAVLALLAELAG